HPRVVSMQYAPHPIVAANLFVITASDRVVGDRYAQAGVRRPIDSVHTHVLQIGSVSTLRLRLNSTALGAFRISSSVFSRMFPSAAWKKHGRTVPSASTTDDTQGALHTVVGNSPRPFSAA